MVKHLFPYGATGYFSGLMLHYLQDDEKVRPLYKYPFNADAFEQAVTDVSNRNYNRTALVQILQKQYIGFTPTAATQKNITLFARQNTFAVVTGHQPCLFTGPLYFIYKIVSAINLAHTLNTLYPNNQFVPVYWMGADDHDFDEINHIQLFGKTLTWEQPLRTATGRIPTHTLAPLLTQLEALLGNSHNAQQLMQLFKTAYLEHPTLDQATRYLVNYLFGEYGLVVVNQDNTQLKSLFAPIMEQELTLAQSYQAVMQTNEYLKQHNYPTQAFARPLNLFYLTDEFRERIIFNEYNQLFSVNHTNLAFTLPQIQSLLQQHPERFSPNVILRPVYQQWVLPSVAYVGGGGELAYWLQLKGVFNLYGANYPILALRNSVLWIEEPVYRKMQQLGLLVQDVFTPTGKLTEQYIAKNSQNTLTLAPQTHQLNEIFDQIAQIAQTIDPTLQTTVMAEAAKATNSLQNLEAKLLRAEKRKFDTALQQLSNLMGKLFPDGNLQERTDNFIPYYLAHGNRFIPQLLDHLQPLDKQFCVLTPA
ncbi:MAG TPA: bacillithiol biosynthesis cysteine-adding enzyme BshC [Chitinophagales bacterium]|nr:bacillithiol biosynthesis cysteine-adding enzyme BshC [Chitinophagales bacterium]HRK29126.1 bacillithiol biosynthesis cysteine-adding enzyme BshC [Chitinophagales bacterium]